MNNTYFFISSVLAAVTCLAAAITDIQKRKIPNIISFPAIIAGLVLTGIYGNSLRIITTIICIIIFFFIGMLNIIGLGDIKLLMALTAIGGYSMALYSFAIAIFSLFVYAMITDPISIYFYIEKLKQRLRLRRFPVDKNKKYPFAPFLLLGVLLYSLCFTQNSIYYINLVDILFGG